MPKEKGYITKGDKFYDNQSIIWELKTLFTIGLDKTVYVEIHDKNGNIKRIGQMQLEYEYTEI